MVCLGRSSSPTGIGEGSRAGACRRGQIAPNKWGAAVDDRKAWIEGTAGDGDAWATRTAFAGHTPGTEAGAAGNGLRSVAVGARHAAPSVAEATPAALGTGGPARNPAVAGTVVPYGHGRAQGTSPTTMGTTGRNPNRTLGRG
jgi:hypothetical protein